MKLDPPRLTRGPLSGRIYVVTHGKILGHDTQGRELMRASVKYDVTDQFYALCAADAAGVSAFPRRDRCRMTVPHSTEATGAWCHPTNRDPDTSSVQPDADRTER